MKKVLIWLLSVLFVASCFAGCTDKAKAGSHADDIETPSINGMNSASDDDALSEDENVVGFGSSDSNAEYEEETEDISSSGSNAG